tara:strand:- start:73 stop:285 length:213 start_codon:yes stop_codon:yes gene_type:complete
MSIKVPKLKTKSVTTRDTTGKIRRYKAPSRTTVLKNLKKLKKPSSSTSFDKKLQPVLVKNVLSNTKIAKT